MNLVGLAMSGGLTLPALALLWTGAIGVLLHAWFPPQDEEIAEALLAASFVP